MVAPVYDYVALHRIPAGQGPAAYQRGDGVMRDAVETWGLVVGEDIIPARPDVLPRPANNAARSEWEAYAIGYGIDRAELDDLTVAQIRDRVPEDTGTDSVPTLDDYPDQLRPVDLAAVNEQGRRLPSGPPGPTPDEAAATGVNAVNVPADDPSDGQPACPAASATKAEWVAYAVSQGMDADEAEDFTKAELQKRYAG